MIIEGEFKSRKPDTRIDYIYIVDQNGNDLSLNWDSSEWWTNDNGNRHFYCQGVYFGDEYANGEIEKLPISGTYECQYYSPESDEEFYDNNLLWFVINDSVHDVRVERSYYCEDNTFNIE